MKKLLLFVTLCLSLISAVGAFNTSGCEEKMFTVTAYYSPKPDQIFYYKSTFHDDVVLNGEGYTWASGKPVFLGMLAWPKIYPFGSLIYFPEIGVGEIADRGGAIVLSGQRGQNYDRIDVWMWKGEEGLIRALTFGKKNMTWWYCDSSIVKKSEKTILTLDSIPILKYFFDVGIWIEDLKPGRKDIRVRTLQKYLVKLWYLNRKYRHGTYDSYTKKALCSYQVVRKIVTAKHTDCWTFGKMTRYTMKLDVQKKGLLPSNLYEKGNFSAILELAKYYNGKVVDIVEKKIWNLATELWIKKSSPKKIFLFYRTYTKWQQSSEIKILQTFLQAQWLYSWTIDGMYSKLTTSAVYEFQKKYWLIYDADALALRGYLWPKTRAKINELRQK